MSLDERRGKDVTSLTARSVRTRAELYRSKLRGEEELRKEQKEAESRKLREEQRLDRDRLLLQESLRMIRDVKYSPNMPKHSSDSSLALNSKRHVQQVPKLIVGSSSPLLGQRQAPEQLSQEQRRHSSDVPRRLRSTLEGDLHRAVKKGADARWDRFQKEKMKKWSSLDLDIMQSDTEGLRSVAFTPPLLQRSLVQKHLHTRSHSPSPLRKISEPASPFSSPKLSTRSISMGNLPSIEAKSSDALQQNSTFSSTGSASVHLPPIHDKKKHVQNSET
ncbi:uncharacterized protein LOC134182375 [Corticium candelabrum]|uniref:uncharacterized protein LOC134182375 n=1 Tax=Corticium candelabrum TaxID=121492 RepID=UPI002E26CF6B|nr:uncharacterized protein LOC134182375 [Corticium candelabrum]